MTNSIEKAAERLEQLRNAGATVPKKVVLADHQAIPDYAEKHEKYAKPSELEAIEKLSVSGKISSSKIINIDLMALAAAGLMAAVARTPVSRAPTMPPMPCTPKASRLSSYFRARLSQTAPA